MKFLSIFAIKQTSWNEGRHTLSSSTLDSKLVTRNEVGRQDVYSVSLRITVVWDCGDRGLCSI